VQCCQRFSGDGACRARGMRADEIGLHLLQARHRFERCCPPPKGCQRQAIGEENQVCAYELTKAVIREVNAVERQDSQEDRRSPNLCRVWQMVLTLQRPDG